MACATAGRLATQPKLGRSGWLLCGRHSELRPASAVLVLPGRMKDLYMRGCRLGKRCMRGRMTPIMGSVSSTVSWLSVTRLSTLLTNDTPSSSGASAAVNGATVCTAPPPPSPTAHAHRGAPRHR